MSEGRRAVVDQIKRRGPLTVSTIASALAVTESNIRLHLQELASHGLVAEEVGDPQVGKRGRPPSTWSLTELARDLFPDRHSDLTVDLIGSIRSALGTDGLDRVIDARSKEQTRAYRQALPRTDAPVTERVRALATRRTAEGYMAEALPQRDGSVLLVENHCPICDAAAVCQGLCRSELDVFRSVLGRDVTVVREKHLLSGDTRCVYRVAPRQPSSKAGGYTTVPRYSGE